MYKIMGRYRGKTEEIDSANTRQEAEYLLAEYQLAYGADWVVSIKSTGKAKATVSPARMLDEGRY